MFTKRSRAVQSSKKDRMFVIKRSGDHEPVYFDQITTRNEKFCEDLDVDPTLVSKKVIDSIYSGIHTSEIDVLSSETALYMSTHQPEYEILAKRIIVSNLHKTTMRDFSKVTERLFSIGQLDEQYHNFIQENAEELNKIPQYERDYDFTYFGFKTLEKSYLTKDVTKEIIERPQHVWMRVATYLRMPDIPKIQQVYELLSTKHFIHASPTLFNAGKSKPQLSSCYLLSMKDDLKDMLTRVAEAGMISKWAGGIGINISMIRSKGSRIDGTGGDSSGIIPFLKLWNDLARYVNQGGKRKGAIAVYLEPHHPDIFEFLKIRKNNTKDEDRCLDLHIALWVPDLFMKRLKSDEDWCLFDPNKVQGLHETYGDDYEQKYLQAEKEKRYDKKVKARELWKEIMISQMETGEPYVLFKDHINNKSNQMNRGVIRGSNLCTEIVEYSDHENFAVCNLASISLPAYVTKKQNSNKWIVYSKNGCPYCVKALNFLSEEEEEINVVECTSKNELPENHRNITGEHRTFPMIFANDEFVGGYTELINNYVSYSYEFDFKKLGDVTELITENMNIVIDKNFYPVPQTKKSNLEMRPTGIGIQGLADILQMLNLSWDNPKAIKLNQDIYAVIYYHSLKKSMELATSEGPYTYFKGSPASEGRLQPDLWKVEPTTVDGLLDWEWLRSEIQKNGLRNSLLVTQMPTASSAQILGNNESFEPYTTNMYVRRVLSGDFPVINQHLYRRLNSLGLWSNDLVDELIEKNGSIQNIDNIPNSVKEVYKTAWEIPTKLMVDYSIARGPYIDQTQSFNVFMAQPDMGKLSSMFMYEWENGIKTGMYYLRRRPKVDAIKFTIMKDTTQRQIIPNSNSLQDEEPEVCTSCMG